MLGTVIREQDAAAITCPSRVVQMCGHETIIYELLYKNFDAKLQGQTTGLLAASDNSCT